ncbi:protein of unknown function [Filimonas lacunae]|uniref:Uracil-DNA glycosylase-like domain-containing protein n=1 Tax=Filimonas lacunae TaxID=477680 RepID=A0A173MQ69_9BACT|nr:uracil-DNA glycosylase family protein [Filimonas lacunae]BAV09599.1 hypothetical protein FLA_5650 [Filimonas lacunae]SIS75754.1 protein of unknown function [Filimonas lacunae]
MYKQIVDFLFHLQLPFQLPPEVGVLDVHKNPIIQQTCSTFYKKFYTTNTPRHMLIGINPGRFGGGVTGIPFTDPIRLERDCGIANDFERKQELSSVFMYDMINAYGGAKAFYHDFYITSISPLGFVKHGKNLNYYDDPALKNSIEPFAVDCINLQLSWGMKRDIGFCIGEGENVKYLRKLNAVHQWFEEIKAVPHPRFIMQYKTKQKQEYVEKYLQILGSK